MDLRTLALGIGVFAMTFLVGWWFNLSALVYGRPASAAMAVPPGQMSPAQTTGGPVAVYIPSLKPVPPPAVQPSTPAMQPKSKSAQPNVVQTKTAASGNAPGRGVTKSKDTQAKAKAPAKRSTVRVRRR
jgi:hypothetical protein